MEQHLIKNLTVTRREQFMFNNIYKEANQCHLDHHDAFAVVYALLTFFYTFRFQPTSPVQCGHNICYSNLGQSLTRHLADRSQFSRESKSPDMF